MTPVQRLYAFLREHVLDCGLRRTYEAGFRLMFRYFVTEGGSSGGAFHPSWANKYPMAPRKSYSRCSPEELGYMVYGGLIWHTYKVMKIISKARSDEKSLRKAGKRLFRKDIEPSHLRGLMVVGAFFHDYAKYGFGLQESVFTQSRLYRWLYHAIQRSDTGEDNPRESVEDFEYTVKYHGMLGAIVVRHCAKRAGLDRWSRLRLERFVLYHMGSYENGMPLLFKLAFCPFGVRDVDVRIAALGQAADLAASDRNCRDNEIEVLVDEQLQLSRDAAIRRSSAEKKQVA